VCWALLRPAAGGYGGAAGGAPAGAPGGAQWQELHDDQGRPYYYNPATGVTQWEKPPGM
jgi:far upstream element-binding protein